MVLRNVMLIGNAGPVDVQIDGAAIRNVSTQPITANPEQQLIQFDNALVFPGLINSHDHLDFNLFPQLGDKTYNSYTEWGNYIHQNYKAGINKVLKIPLELREQWGIYKNLLCGVTTVINHGEKVSLQQPLIKVHEQYYCLHSVGFEKSWRPKLNNPLKNNLPYVIHVGEGKNKEAHHEIDRLIRWNLLKKPLIGVHGVAMSRRQASKFKAVVWCPQSNYFLLNKTAPVNELKKNTTLLFGTDSTLTAHWDIWEHIRLARKTKLLPDIDLYHTLNKNAAAIWKTGCAKIEVGKKADIVIVKPKTGDTVESFFATEPEDILLVIQKGEIKLFDETLLEQLTNIDLNNFNKVYINNSCKYVVGNLPELITAIKTYYPEAHFPVTAQKHAVC